MAKTKAKSRKKATNPKATGARGAADGARKAWEQAVSAFVAAEQQAEAKVKRLLAEKKIGRKEASAALKALQARVEREKTAAGKRVTALVQQALASLNIPSRREVAELTRTVEQLSRKIDGLKRRK
jgi:polyhydroxyalkanoate synthesis regulator phasin